jgi:serine/threonine protein kinase
MAGLQRLLRCIGRASLVGGARALASLVPFGEVIFDIARDARAEFGRGWATAAGPEAPPVPREDAPVTLAGPQRPYTLRGLVAVGDVADVHLARDESDSGAPAVYALKVSRVPGGHVLLDNERHALANLLAAAKDTPDGNHLPALVESFPAADRFRKRVNVFRYEPGFRTLEEVHKQYPALDGRHLAGIGQRLLTVLGFSHRRGILHGAVLPAHVLVHAGDPGLRLVGWGQSVPTGRRITAVPTRYRDWYPPEVLARRPASPATDLNLAARCLIYLVGGDPVAGRLPDAVPLPLRRFLETCLLERPGMRPGDAWALRDEFAALLQRLYGPPAWPDLPLS